MGYSILWDLAILVVFGVLAISAKSRSVSLGCALALFGLVCVDLVSQLAASTLERMVLDAAYPHLYQVMLLKNLAFLGLSVLAIVRAVESGERAHYAEGTGSLARVSIN